MWCKVIDQTTAAEQALTADDPFFAVARAVYSGNELWPGESEQAIVRQFSPSSDWFCDGGIAWLGCVEQSRLAGFYSANCRIDGEAVAYFGFWESAPETQHNQTLFAGFERWAKEQGAQRVYGPINFTTYQSYRIKLSDFDQRPFIGEPFNPDYYPALLADVGYDVHYRYFTHINDDLAELAQRIAPVLQQGLEKSKGRFTLSRLDGETWLNNLPELYPLVDRIFQQNFAYTPISFVQFEAACGEPFAKKLCPQSSVMARDEKGDIAGFFLCYPDYSELLAVEPDIAPGDLNYSEHFNRIPGRRLALAKTGGVHPDYRKAGLFTLMSMQLTLWAAPHYQRVAGAMVREDNPSRQYASHGDLVREYALFTRALTEDAGDEC